MLPPDTQQRMARRLRALARFPEIGPALHGRWAGTRYVLGPWSWLLIVYEHDASADAVIVLTLQDARRAEAPTNE